MSDMIPMYYNQPVAVPAPRTTHAIMDAFLAGMQGISAISGELPKNATPEQIIYHAHAQVKLSQTPQATVAIEGFTKALDAVIADQAAQRQLFQ